MHNMLQAAGAAVPAGPWASSLPKGPETNEPEYVVVEEEAEEEVRQGLLGSAGCAKAALCRAVRAVRC